MSKASHRSATPNACPRATRQRSWEEHCRKSTSGSATVPPKRASLWRATDSAVLGEFRKRAVIDRQCLDARAPAPFGDQLLHVVANLVETREPDAALLAHVVEQFGPARKRSTGARGAQTARRDAGPRSAGRSASRTARRRDCRRCPC